MRYEVASFRVFRNLRLLTFEFLLRQKSEFCNYYHRSIKSYRHYQNFSKGFDALNNKNANMKYKELCGLYVPLIVS